MWIIIIVAFIFVVAAAKRAIKGQLQISFFYSWPTLELPWLPLQSVFNTRLNEHDYVLSVKTNQFAWSLKGFMVNS